jgi:hypothetical protein
MIVVYDIETASLSLESPVWCLFLTIDGGEPLGYSEHAFNDLKPISEAFRTMQRADEIWGWNNLSFDSLVLNHRYGVTFENEHDGLVQAKLLWDQDGLLEDDLADSGMPTNLRGSYSLEAFGYRLGNRKLHIDSFEQLSDEMLVYCSQDVKLTRDIVRRIKSDEYQLSPSVVKLEEDTARIIASQTVYGWEVDVPAAKKLKIETERQLLKLKVELRNTFKPKFLPDGKEKTPSRPVWIKNELKEVGYE